MNDDDDDNLMEVDKADDPMDTTEVEEVEQADEPMDTTEVEEVPYSREPGPIVQSHPVSERFSAVVARYLEVIEKLPF